MIEQHKKKCGDMRVKRVPVKNVEILKAMYKDVNTQIRNSVRSTEGF